MDYMFFFPHRSSGGEPLVPATCQVEKFLVDRAKDIGAPVTQLSDHYGASASIAVVSVPYDSPAQGPTKDNPTFDTGDDFGMRMEEDPHPAPKAGDSEHGQEPVVVDSLQTEEQK